MPKLFIYGFPGLYGGAGTELHHQIKVWVEMGMDLHIIPTMSGYQNEPLYQEMLDLGLTIHNPHQFSVISQEDAIINFCSSLFLDNCGHINNFTKRTIFVNCMTYIFKPDEVTCHQKGQIAFSLYQRDGVMEEHEAELSPLGVGCQFMKFVPYFDASSLEFSVKNQEKVHIGRISRDCQFKYAPSTVPIYESIVSPKLKEGHFLGFGGNAMKSVGKVPEWIKTYVNQNKLSVKDFYNTVDFIVQPTLTTENWPRIGFEAMFSGKPLVVDNRGGWKSMIEHGVTGFLCDNDRDFIYYGSKLAYEPEFREEIAYNAAEAAARMSNMRASAESWERIFERVFN